MATLRDMLVMRKEKALTKHSNKSKHQTEANKTLNNFNVRELRLPEAHSQMEEIHFLDVHVHTNSSSQENQSLQLPRTTPSA